MSLATKLRLPTASDALPGREEALSVPERHFVNGNPMRPPFSGLESAVFGLGCFWGAERISALRSSRKPYR